MKQLKYTPKIITLLSAGKKLEAIKEAKDTYGLTLPQAKDMINAYRPWNTYYFLPFELSSSDANGGNNNSAVSSPVKQTNTQPSTVPENSSKTISNHNDMIPYCCPNCGSEQVKKSIGGKLEQVAAIGVTKAIKSYVLGDYGGLTGGAENEILKETVPFQQVCKYCHQTFHASLAQIASGKYAMDKNKAEKLKDAYNGKLQIVKDNEVEEIREKGSKSLKRAFLAGITLVVGLLISANCQHTESGFLGLESYTGTYMFAWVLMLAGGVGVLIEGISSYGSYSEASALDDMSIQEYAKNHSA